MVGTHYDVHTHVFTPGWWRLTATTRSRPGEPSWHASRNSSLSLPLPRPPRSRVDCRSRSASTSFFSPPRLHPHPHAVSTKYQISPAQTDEGVSDWRAEVAISTVTTTANPSLLFPGRRAADGRGGMDGWMDGEGERKRGVEKLSWTAGPWSSREGRKRQQARVLLILANLLRRAKHHTPTTPVPCRGRASEEPRTRPPRPAYAMAGGSGTACICAVVSCTYRILLCCETNSTGAPLFQDLLLPWCVATYMESRYMSGLLAGGYSVTSCAWREALPG